MSGSVKRISSAAMFAALSFAAVLLGKLIPDVAGFLSYDPKDAVVAIAGFLLGPWVALSISLLVPLVEMLTISSTGIYGMIMNFLSTASFALPAVLWYRRDRSFRGAVLGLSVGVAFMTACMVLWNYLITPFYMGVSRETVAGMLVPVFLPFNAIKGGLNAALTLILYKPLVTALRRTGLVSRSEGGEKKPYHVSFLVLALVIFTVFVLLFLHLIEVI